MNQLSVAIIGLIGVAFMGGIHLGIERLGMARSQVFAAIATFVSLTPIRSRLVSGFIHVLAGLLFTWLYAGVFDLLHPLTVGAYVKMGAGLGLAHGLLLSFFLLTDLASVDVQDNGDNRSLTGALINILSHVGFGAILGLGFGARALTSSFPIFVLIAIGTFAVVAGVYVLALEPVLKRYVKNSGPS
jgi:hypothetical protein